MAHLVTEEQVCQELGLTREILRHWVEIGLVEVVRDNDVSGFDPGQLRRLWSIISLQRDLEVNLAAVRIILDLSRELGELKLAVREASRQLDCARRLGEFRLRVLEEHTGPIEWDIDL